MSARLLWLAALGFLAVALAGLVLRPLTPIDETRYVDVAWEMWLNHSYLVPTRNFELYSHKPPLLFWLINLVWAVSGVSEFAARLVGPAAALACLPLTAALARRLWPEDPQIGTRAGLALAGSMFFAVAGGLTMFDALLTVTVLWGMLALVQALGGQRRGWLWLGLAIAAGVLAKGPVVLLHLVPALVLVRFWRGAPAQPHRPPHRPPLWQGAGLALLVALGALSLWLVPALILGGPAYREAILWTQSAGRITQSFAHARPWWVFLAASPLLFFPWIWVPALWRATRQPLWHEPGLRLALVWLGGALLAFSLISGKQLHYLLPELPAAALIVARLARGVPGFSLALPALPVALLALALAVVASGLVDPGRDAATLLHPAPVVLAIALTLVSVLWLAQRRRGLWGGVILSLGVTLALNLLIGLTDMRAQYDTRPLAARLDPYRDTGVAFYGQLYHAEFNFAARLTAPVATPKTLPDLQAWIAAHPKGVVIARLGKNAPDWPPEAVIPLRLDDYALWRVEQRPTSDPRIDHAANP